MTRETVTVDEGAGALRSWRVDRVATDLEVEIWTPWRGKVLLTAALVVVALPAPLLWAEVEGLRIAHVVTATVYSLAVLFCVIGVTSGAGREHLRLRRGKLTVRRFEFVTWSLVELETASGVGIWVRDQWWAALLRTLLVQTPRRVMTFGFWLDHRSAERIAECLRAEVEPVSRVHAELDGVVRRVARMRDARTIEGAEDLVVLDQQSGRVFRGALREAPIVSPWLVIAPLAALCFVLSPRGATSAGMTIGGLIVAIAATYCRGGVADQIARARTLGIARANPGEPWRAVRMWRSNVMPRGPLRRARLQVSMVILFAAMSAFALSGLVGSSSTARTVTGCVFGLAAVLWVYRAQNVLFMGLTEVRLRELPYRTPGEVAIDFAVGRRGGHFSGITFTLRRLVQVKRAGQPPAVGYSHVGHYDLPDDEPPPGAGEQVTARFRLPADAGGNDVDAPRPVYWELLVEGETSCGAYAETFPVPIYGGESS